jgi:helicase
LISTNTIGQGLNFPIKNLIIHSTIINGGENINVEVRDFWNIVGRAGRAGMETEGQIIYNVKSWRDGQEYARYTNKNNITPADSIFLKVLSALASNRMSTNVFESNIKILAEPYLLNLITEESIGTDDEDVIKAILNNSLFSIQCLARQIDVEPLKRSFRNIFLNIKDKADITQIKVYAETGLCLKSNQDIENFIQANFELLENIIEGDEYIAMIELMLNMFDELTLEELESQKFTKIGVKFTAYFSVTKLWMYGAEIDTIQAEWININRDKSLFNLLVAEGFYFRFPWLMSSFLTLVAFKMNIERDAFPSGIANLISYIKYGLTDPEACLLRSIGISK